ncbi:MAG: TRAP transporter small permease subunit [Deltaproteobacteria bacterium]|nr:TRAP transporter small permease subunit [Deltaproteobacteria bacterium]
MNNNNKPQVNNSVKISDAIDKIILSIGHIIMWANGVLILVIICQVILRYGFGKGLVVLEELQWHLYALGIMFGASYALTLNSHIRVDIIHSRLSATIKSILELFGIFFLLFPFVIIIFHQSLDFVYESWRVNESSIAPMGLPFRWLIKAVIPITFAMIGLAGISRVIRIINSLKKGTINGI